MVRLGLHDAAVLHRRIAARLGANPFCAGFPTGVVSILRRLGAKTYFACKWADVAIGFVGGPHADGLRLDGTGGFERLAESAQADHRRSRWLLEGLFELQADTAYADRSRGASPAARRPLVVPCRV